MDETDITAKLYYDTLLKDNNDDKFFCFLNSLNSNEFKAYLYIEAKRISCFLEELGFTKSDNLFERHNENIKNKHVLKSHQSFNFLLQFRNDCSIIPKPNENVIKSLIEKHNSHLRQLTDSEIKFFMES